jgi:hypothetical protein
MPLVPINDLGSIGIIKDIPPYALPENAWSDGNNVRFLNNGVKKIRGYTEVMATCPFAPYYILPYEDANGNYYWLAFGTDDIAVWDNTNWTDITRQTTLVLSGPVAATDTTITVDTGAALTALSATGSLKIGTEITSDLTTNRYETFNYSGRNTSTGVITLTSPAQLAYLHPDDAVVTPTLSTTTVDLDYDANTTSRKWAATDHNGIVIATNGHDTPQMWPLSSGIPNKVHPMMELSNWPSAETETCRVIRSFRTFLVGLNWDRTNPEPRLVKWSTEASFYSAPRTWDESDETLDAGEYELSDTPGEIVDGLALGDSFIIYKNDSIYIMNYVGTPYIFSFKLLTPTIGCLTKNAVAEFEGGHFFMGNSDFYLNNGQTIQPLLPDRLRRAVFDVINAGDTSNPSWMKCFVVADHLHNEMLACYPSDASTTVDKAVIWNWRTNTFSMRDLPTTSHIASGIMAVFPTGQSWTATTGDWNSSSDAWGSSAYDTHLENLVFADVTNTKMYRDNNGNKNDTANMTAYIERSGYDLGDPQQVKFISAVYPEIEVSGNNTVNVYVGSQMSTESSIEWNPETGGAPYTFDPNSQSKVSCRISGKYFGIRVESTGDLDWKLHGLAFEVKPRGKRGSRMM